MIKVSICFTIVAKFVSIHKNAYDAAINSDAIVIVTEWDEFKELDFQSIYKDMNKPAFLFDGRLMMDTQKLRKIGFTVESIGKA
jgi:UDPglucose 6-dehydrogenase